MQNDRELLKLLLPEYLIEYFEEIKFQEENKILYLYFEEKKCYSEKSQSRGQTISTVQNHD